MASFVVDLERFLSSAKPALELLDEDVARFVTISDACVPVRTFPEVRAYLLDGGQDQVGSS